MTRTTSGGWAVFAALIASLVTVVGDAGAVEAAGAGATQSGEAATETVEWRDQVISVPMKPSSPGEAHWSRRIVFQGCKEIGITQDWSNNDLFAEKRGNALFLQLRNPAFTTPIHVDGDNGRFYSLFVFASDRAEPLAPVVVVTTPPAGGAGSGKAEDLPESISSQRNRVAKHVFGWKPQDGVRESADYDLEALKQGEKRVGRRIVENDTFSAKSIKIYRYKEMSAYMVVIEYKGDKPRYFFNFQTVYVPNFAGAMPRTIDFIDPKFPGIMLEKGKPRVVYYFTRNGG